MTVDVMTRQEVIQDLRSETNNGHEMQIQTLSLGYTSVSFEWVLLNFAFHKPWQRGVEVFLETEGYRYEGLLYSKSLAGRRSLAPTLASEGKGCRKLWKWDSWLASGTAW